MSWESIMYNPIVFFTNISAFTIQLLGIIRLSPIPCVLVYGSYAFGETKFLLRKNYIRTSVISWESIKYSLIVFLTNIFAFMSQLLELPDFHQFHVY